MIKSSLGLDAFPFIHTRDFDTAAVAHRRLHNASSADIRGNARHFEWRANLVDLGPIRFTRAFYRGGLRLSGVPVDYLLNLSRQGPAEGTAEEQRMNIESGRSAALFSPDGPASWTYEGTLLCTTVRIDPSFLESDIEALTGQRSLHRRRVSRAPGLHAAGLPPR